MRVHCNVSLNEIRNNPLHDIKFVGTPLGTNKSVTSGVFLWSVGQYVGMLVEWKSQFDSIPVSESAFPLVVVNLDLQYVFDKVSSNYEFSAKRLK